MKKRAILALVILFVTVGAFAATLSPFKTLKQDIGGLIGDGDTLSGNDCEVSAKSLDAATIKVSIKNDKGKEVTFYAHDGKLTLKEKNNGGDYSNTYKDQSGRTLKVTVVDDAYNAFEIKDGSNKISCEQDM